MLQSSLVAWCYYLLGAAGLMACFWWLTKGLQSSRLRRSLRVAVAIMLVCPFSVGDGYADMAPAILMMAMETVFEGSEAFLRVGPALFGLTLLGVLLTLALDQYLRLQRVKKVAEEDLHRHRDELLAETE
tara:strand:+ start:4366 stop:4755 length:390 start_codon:yes stop_codon:yes gene_type:complete